MNKPGEKCNTRCILARTDVQNVNDNKEIFRNMGWKGIKTGLVRRKGGRSGESEAGRTGDTYPGKCKERTVLLFSISGRCFCLHFRERFGRDQNHRNRWRILPFFTGISAGTLCEKAGGSTTRVFTYAAALPVSAPFPGKSGGQTFMEPGL